MRKLVNFSRKQAVGDVKKNLLKAKEVLVADG